MQTWRESGAHCVQESGGAGGEVSVLVDWSASK